MKTAKLIMAMVWGEGGAKMNMAKLIMAMVWVGCWGTAIALFGLQGDWGMVALTIGMFAAVVYIVCWIIDCM